MAKPSDLIELVWAAFLALTSRAARRLPPQKRSVWAARTGRWFGRLFPAKWSAVEKNLAVINAFSHQAFQAASVFESFGLMLGDFLSQAPVALEVEGREKAEAAKAEGKGIVFITGHMGHWELGGNLLVDWGWDVTAVYQAYRTAAMRNVIQAHRSRLKYLSVGHGAAAGALTLLRRGKTVAFLGDIPYGEKGHPVTLCGKTYHMPRGPFMLACRTGASVMTGFVIREKPGHYRAIIEGPFRPLGCSPSDVDELIGRMAPILEKYIIQYSDQWYAFNSVFE